MKLRRALVGLFFLALGAAALRDLARIGPDLPWRVMYDFPDFYCAGAAIDGGANAYTYEPLRTCEHRVNRKPSLQANPSLAIPAPQPPYDFPAFMALARLGFAQARLTYALSVIVAVALCALVLTRLGIPLDIAALGLLLGAGYHELDAGQIIPFALLCLIFAGWMLATRRDWLAGIFAGLTAIEPHVGLGAALAMLLFVPRARVSTIVTCLCLAAIGIAVAGWHNFLTYILRVLPAQAAAEVRFPPQYSLTYLLHAAAFPDKIALELGALSFALFSIAGLAIAPRLSQSLGRRELLVFFPAATAVIAGAYVHVVELCFAVPAALVLACFASGTQRKLAAAALSLLAVPWIAAWSTKKLFLASVFVVAALLFRLRAGASIGFATALAVVGCLYIFELHPPELPTPVARAASAFRPDALVQDEWASVVRQLDVRDPWWLAIKLPGWCALAAIFAIGLSEYRAAQRRSAVAPERIRIDGRA